MSTTARTTHRILILSGVIGLAAQCMCTAAANATDIQDMARIKGLEQNELIGMGLVAGLNGTGDTTKKSQRLSRPLLALYNEFGFGLESTAELEGVDSVAIVMLSCNLPESGVREGDTYDLEVAVAGDAKSLTGGRLVRTVLKAKKGDAPFAVAQGDIEIDSKNPRRGVIHGGAQMLKDIRVNPVNPKDGTITLVIDEAYATYPVATAVAARISEEFAVSESRRGEVWATTPDPKNVVVHFREDAGIDAADVLGQIMTLSLDLETLNLPARVTINRDAGLITVSIDAEITATAITTRSMQISRITPEPIATKADPIITTENLVGLAAPRLGDDKAKARLSDLVTALETLKIPFEERVAVLEQMKAAGTLHGQIVYR